MRRRLKDQMPKKVKKVFKISRKKLNMKSLKMSKQVFLKLKEKICKN